jgi:hypothetical protein
MSFEAGSFALFSPVQPHATILFATPVKCTSADASQLYILLSRHRIKAINVGLVILQQRGFTEYEKRASIKVLALCFVNLEKTD